MSEQTESNDPVVELLSKIMPGLKGAIENLPLVEELQLAQLHLVKAYHIAEERHACMAEERIGTLLAKSEMLIDYLKKG